MAYIVCTQKTHIIVKSIYLSIEFKKNLKRIWEIVLNVNCFLRSLNIFKLIV